MRSPGSKAIIRFVFTYDRGQDRLLTTIANSAGQTTLEYPLYAAQVLALGSGHFTPADLNQLTISLVDNDANGSFELRDLVLDEQPLGDLRWGGRLDRR